MSLALTERGFFSFSFFPESPTSVYYTKPNTLKTVAAIICIKGRSLHSGFALEVYVLT